MFLTRLRSGVTTLTSGGLVLKLDGSAGTFLLEVDGALWVEGGESAIAYSRGNTLVQVSS